MRYVAAYLLAVLGGNRQPSEADLKNILSSVGIDADPACMKKVIESLKGKNIHDVIAEGHSKLASVPTGGAAVAAGGAAPAGDAAAPAEEKKEEKKPEPESESDDDMGFGLFD